MRRYLVVLSLGLMLTLGVNAAKAETVDGISGLSLIRVLPYDAENYDLDPYNCHFVYCVGDFAESNPAPGEQSDDLNLGAAFTVRSAYNATGDLNCHDKAPVACNKCFNNAKSRFNQTTRLQVKNKLLKSDEALRMRSLFAEFINELKGSCDN